MNICLSLFDPVSGQASFSQQPVDSTVVEGGEVILYCAVDKLEVTPGILWTKGSSNVPLGLSRDMPGYPRYNIVGKSFIILHHLALSTFSKHLQNNTPGA